MVFYGGNFAVRASALAAIGGFDVAIDFHGEDTNLGRRLHAAGPVELRGEGHVHTSARRYRAMGTGAVIRCTSATFALLDACSLRGVR